MPETRKRANLGLIFPRIGGIITSKVAESGTKWWKVVSSKMYMGEYNHTIDTKGRLIMPAKFRELLGEEFVITKGFDGNLLVYDDEAWLAVEEKLSNLPINQESRLLVRIIAGGACHVEVDKQGRILIPGNLREFAGLNKDVVLVGAAGKIEVWDKDKYDKMASFENMDAIAEKLADLGLSI